MQLTSAVGRVRDNIVLVVYNTYMIHVDFFKHKKLSSQNFTRNLIYIKGSVDKRFYFEKRAGICFNIWEQGVFGGYEVFGNQLVNALIQLRC